MFEEQFVTYKIALKLKNLGFNDDCFGGYDKDKDLINLLSNPFETSPLSRYPKIIKAPLWQQAVKWIREKHNIDITIHRSFSMKKSYHYCIIVNCDYDNEIQQECVPNRIYEEALEEGLYQALLLIKKR